MGRTLGCDHAGRSQAEAPTEDRLEETWRRYYASIFNPARLKVKAMQNEMPKKYWRNLPEASLIKPLIAGGGARDRQRHDRERRHRTAQGAETAGTRNGPPPMPVTNVEALRDEAAQCRACPLWKDATQTVFGEGPPGAPMMFVGEQPGDMTKTSPVARSSDRPESCSIARSKTRDSIAHRFTSPMRSSISNGCRAASAACTRSPTRARSTRAGPGTSANVAAVKPDLVVAMGATAAQCVFGKITPINKSRGRLIDLDDGTRALVTVHPSYLLRLPNAEARALEYQRFVEDLKIAADLLRKSARAA